MADPKMAKTDWERTRNMLTELAGDAAAKAMLRERFAKGIGDLGASEGVTKAAFDLQTIAFQKQLDAIRRQLAEMVQVLGDERVPPDVRARALVALGMIAEAPAQPAKP